VTSSNSAQSSEKLLEDLFNSLPPPIIELYPVSVSIRLYPAWL
jgi:hypothetical protein